MTLSQVKSVLPQLEQLRFRLPNGDFVPAHFHITEVGKISKHFVDCGGTVRREDVISFQLWSAADVYHRLKPSKLTDILQMSERTLSLIDLEIEVEYQTDTIGKFGLDFDGQDFLLTSKQTDCLAKSNCGVPAPIKQVAKAVSNCCAPGSGCC